jgi:hypothetical protein
MTWYYWRWWIFALSRNRSEVVQDGQGVWERLWFGLYVKIANRPYRTVSDAFGHPIKMPSSLESGDWVALCECGRGCGGTFGQPPNDDDRKYVACPDCSNVGESGIGWHRVM